MTNLRVEELTFFKSLDVTLQPLLHFFPGFLAHVFLVKKEQVKSQEECHLSDREKSFVSSCLFRTWSVVSAFVTLKPAGLIVAWAVVV